jgi:Tol biopolymer transport system component
VTNADGSRRRVLTQNASVYGEPTWSPDGKQIAFVCKDQATIYVMNSDGSGPRALTHAYTDNPRVTGREQGSPFERTRTVRSTP